MRYLFLLLGLLLCAAAPAGEKIILDEARLPLFNQFNHDGFFDCVFKIDSFSQTTDHYKLYLLASYKGDMLGMYVTVSKKIKAGFDADQRLIDDRVYPGGVVFSRSGVESDRLISVLSELYGNKPQRLRMVAEEAFTVVAIHQKAINLKTDNVELKLFGRDTESDPEELYSESFLDLDIKNGLAFWKEKDPSYRLPLINALSGH